jgi:hypothetical protein
MTVETVSQPAPGARAEKIIETWVRKYAVLALEEDS